MFVKAFFTTLKRVSPALFGALFALVGGLWLTDSPILTLLWFWCALLVLLLFGALVFTPIEFHRLSYAARKK
jgi:hypothetical protein